MKLIANVSQTYGSVRYKEIDQFTSDNNVAILNKLDYITFSFHNCTSEFIEYAKNKIITKLPTCIFYEFNNIPYCESIRLYLMNLLALGCTDYILWQDDHYINDNQFTARIFDKLLSYYKSSDINYLGLFGNSYGTMLVNNIPIHETRNIIDNLYIYQVDCNEINRYDQWLKLNNYYSIYAYTDENYVASIEFALQYFFTFENANLNVWALESKLCYDSAINNIRKWISNAILFYRSSFSTKDIIGVNTDLLPLLDMQNVEHFNNSILIT